MPPDPPQPDDGGQGLTDEQILERFGRIEHTQQEQGGMLQAILDRVSGGARPPAGPEPAGSTPPASGGLSLETIQAATRREIEQAEARRKQEEREAADARWRDEVNAVVEHVKPELTPREPVAGIRGKLQRAMFGGE